MMRCETCSHECTMFDFVALRNLCEHFYLDSLAQKQNQFLGSSTISGYAGRDDQRLLPRSIKAADTRDARLPLGTSMIVRR